MKNGFSIIELLCVLGLVGLLTTFAYPSYQKQLTQARRLDGMSALFDLATKLEQHHLKTGSYQTKNQLTDMKSLGGFYELSITKASNHDYLLKAMPIKDSKLPILTLDSTGKETSN